ncbi:MAG TPA: hypothetical protein VN794_10485, partial [Methylomirabilota bacterium]|nr:hypothetical protein [Methylomirabilota bacterium]
MNPFSAGRTARRFLIKLGTLGAVALLVAARFSIPAQANVYNVTGTADGAGVITPIVPGTFS